ncbi:MAG: hypothetical protein ACR2NS_03360 [Gemmatimonadaceae bacterium]
MTLAELDYLHDADSNSIGALLAHMAAVEWSYQVVARVPTRALSGAVDGGAAGHLGDASCARRFVAGAHREPCTEDQRPLGLVSRRGRRDQSSRTDPLEQSAFLHTLTPRDGSTSRRDRTVDGTRS